MLDTATVVALKPPQTAQTVRMVRYQDIWREAGSVFDRGDGAPLHPDSIYQRFVALADRLKLPRIRRHDLRHTSATLMLAQGVHPKIVSERLGHSSVNMTLDRYSHVSMDMQREAAGHMESLLGA